MQSIQGRFADPVLDKPRFTADPEVDEILLGAVDLHVHSGPSPFPRRVSIRDAALDADDTGFSAIVVKSHHLPLQTDVLAVHAAGGLNLRTEVHGGIALNRTVGGINPYAVELVLRMGGKVVWMPTLSSQAHYDHHHAGGTFPLSGIELREQQPLSVLGEDGRISRSVADVLSIIAEEQAILNCGHLPAAEIAALLPEAAQHGVERIVISHPDFILGVTPSDLAEWTRTYGVYVEHVALMLVTEARERSLADTLERFKDVPMSHTIISSDLGQVGLPLPVTGFRMFARQALDAGLGPETISALTGGNARGLLAT